jgi:hypothetical protein
VRGELGPERRRETVAGRPGTGRRGAAQCGSDNRRGE